MRIFNIIRLCLICIIGFMLCSCVPLTSENSVRIESGVYQVRHFDYKNHKYIHIYNIGMVHNPDCKCSK